MEGILQSVLATATQFSAATLPWLSCAETVLANPWIRALGLAAIVYLTIRVIASVYSGDKQNSELGPVGIRPHSAQRLERETIMLPRALMPMNMDGVAARLKIFYAFTDARGKRRRHLVYERPQARIAVSPINLRTISTTIYGQEVPDVATSDVCFPPVEMDRPPSELPATPDRALEYVALHKIIENWREDDNALLISMHADELDSIKADRDQWITDEARKVKRAREGNFIERMFYKGIAARRPNVVGSYYIKLEFSHDPWFVLTRHPDRELKMTAWLTVLTSMFALVMDAWPKAPPQGADAGPRIVHERTIPARAPVRPPH